LEHPLVRIVGVVLISIEDDCLKQDGTESLKVRIEAIGNTQNDEYDDKRNEYVLAFALSQKTPHSGGHFLPRL